MFGIGFGELVVIVIVALIVVGPKDLPRLLRKLGQWSAKMRRMAADLRRQSGIDDVLHGEGIAEDINEIKKLARGQISDIKRAATVPMAAAVDENEDYDVVDIALAREREYPREGPDGYGALPDTTYFPEEELKTSDLARDALYLVGDPDAELPPHEPPAGEPEDPTDADPAASANDSDAAKDASGDHARDSATSSSESTSETPDSEHPHASDEARPDDSDSDDRESQAS